MDLFKTLSIRRTLHNILIVVIFSIGFSILGLFLSSVFSFEFFKHFFTSPLLIVMNAIPLTLLMLFFYFITSRLWATYFIAGGFFLFIQYVNRFKILLRQEPLVPADILLGNETTNVLKFSELPIKFSVYLIVFSFLIIGIYLFKFVKSNKLHPLIRTTGALLAVVLSITLFYTLYNNIPFYSSFNVRGSKYSSVNVVRHRGFVYSFLAKANSFKLVKPPNYSPESAKTLLQKNSNFLTTLKLNSVSVKPKQPHVFAIMSEAFFDFDKIQSITFNKGLNPLKNFNNIYKESYSGKIVTNVTGGGTSCTEFSFLTGHSLSLMDWISDPYAIHVRKDTFALPRILESEGYQTTAFHPGTPWFYNRFNVYDYFGFNNKYFRNNMIISESENKNAYISDMTAYKFLLNKFNDHLIQNPQTPYFDFTITIQNHGPYEKTNLGYPEILQKNNTLSASDYNTINNYLFGLMKCDQALGYLIDKFSKTEEPIVLLYFGDHIPFLGEDFSGYKALKYSIGISENLEEFLNAYETPYFIWSNTPAKELLKSNGISNFVGQAPLISPNFLAVELFKYLGITSSPYINYLTTVEQSLPVITSRFYKTGTGNFSQTLTKSEKDVLSEYRNLQYYMMFDNEVK